MRTHIVLKPLEIDHCTSVSFFAQQASRFLHRHKAAGSTYYLSTHNYYGYHPQS